MFLSIRLIGSTRIIVIFLSGIMAPPSHPKMGMVTEASRPVYARPSLERARDDPAEKQFRRRLWLYQELTVRGGVALVIVAFQLVFPVEPPVTARCISLLALLGLFLNSPYFLAARSGRAFRAQAYVRMLVDVLLI